jgi:hypothetical protein
MQAFLHSIDSQSMRVHDRFRHELHTHMVIVLLLCLPLLCMQRSSRVSSMWSVSNTVYAAKATETVAAKSIVVVKAYIYIYTAIVPCMVVQLIAA